MNEPIWLSRALVIEIHAEQLLRYGGPNGIRDLGMLESALDRPRNKWHYQGGDLADFAAAYAYGIAKNQPFVDGNKRTSLVVSFTFLGINGIDFNVPQPEAVIAMLNLASGELDEESLARWIRDRSAGV